MSGSWPVNFKLFFPVLDILISSWTIELYRVMTLFVVNSVFVGKLYIWKTKHDRN